MSDLKKEIERLRKAIYGGNSENVKYMSDMDNWVCVHATKYEPKHNSDGEAYIETTASATDYRIPRATVHSTLNWVVASHGGGNWDEASIVVLMPYKDLVNKNGTPQQVSTYDTFFIPDPDKGLILPDSTYIVRADPSCDELFKIGKNNATYKTDYYTDDEIKDILSLSDTDKEEYEEYMKGDIPEYMVKQVLGNNERLLKTYEKTENKKEFMKGILAEDRYIILNKLLQRVVVEKSLEKMGYKYIYGHHSETREKVSDVAIKAGLNGCPHGQGHSDTINYIMEMESTSIVRVTEALQRKDIDKFYSEVKCLRQPVQKEIISSILNGSPLSDVYKFYQNRFNKEVTTTKNLYDMYSSKIQYIIESKMYKQKLEQLGENGIDGHNPFLATVLHRHSDRIMKQYNQALDNIKENPELYAKLQQKFRTQGNMNAFSNSGIGSM